MPTPHKDEDKKDFLSRCMGDPETQKYDTEQRYAVCNSLWDEHFKVSNNGEVTNQVKPSEK